MYHSSKLAAVLVYVEGKRPRYVRHFLDRKAQETNNSTSTVNPSRKPIVSKHLSVTKINLECRYVANKNKSTVGTLNAGMI